MRIQELIQEQQTIGSVGSTTMPTNQPVQPVSQTPKPGSTNQQQDKQQDPNAKQLTDLLKQNQINVKSVDDFLRAYTAIQQKQQLNPEQEKVLGDYAKATMVKPSLPGQMAVLMKNLSKTSATTSAGNLAKPQGT